MIPKDRGPTHPAFRMLSIERRALCLARMGADMAAHLFPDDLQCAEDQAVAVALLDAWDTAHADEWNALKPWYEKRIGQ